MPGALPQGKNNPKRCPYGLYAEQLSGTAFTVPRRVNQRSWLYRIKPSVVHDPFQPCSRPNTHLTASTSGCQLTPNQLRWAPRALPSEDDVDFVRGLCTVCCAGSAGAKDGYAIHTYAATASMIDCCLANADGDLLVVPQLGTPPDCQALPGGSDPTFAPTSDKRGCARACACLPDAGNGPPRRPA